MSPSAISRQNSRKKEWEPIDANCLCPGRILVSGFEPFGGQTINPSAEILSHLPHMVGGYFVKTVLLPVSFEKGPEVLLNEIKKTHADIVVSLGQAAGRPNITIEKVAINYIQASIPDGDGKQPGGKAGKEIVEDGPDGLFSTLPVSKIVSAWKEQGIPGDLSLSAGSYVCNTVLYRALLSNLESKYFVPTGFIHVPLLPCQAAAMDKPMPSMSLDDMVQAVVTALNVICGVDQK